jgi:hypothetical protein
MVLLEYKKISHNVFYINLEYLLGSNFMTYYYHDLFLI